jgi:hypothetical protein
MPFVSTYATGFYLDNNLLSIGASHVIAAMNIEHCKFLPCILQ